MGKKRYRLLNKKTRSVKLIIEDIEKNFYK